MMATKDPTRRDLLRTKSVLLERVAALEDQVEDLAQEDNSDELAERDELLLRIADACDDEPLGSRWSGFSREIKDLLGIGFISLGELLYYPEEVAA